MEVLFPRDVAGRFRAAAPFHLGDARSADGYPSVTTRPGFAAALVTFAVPVMRSQIATVM